jgi:hypothetical protein
VNRTVATQVALTAAGLFAALAVRGAEVSDYFEIALPASFLKPATGQYAVTGYPIEGITPYDDALRRWTGQRAMRVQGVRRIYEENGTRIGVQDGIVFVPDSFIPPKVLPPTDTCFIEGDPVVVMGAATFDPSPVNASSVPKPAWVSVLPEGLYGIGVSRFRRGMPGPSWALADENAIVSLARNISVDFAHSTEIATEERDFSPWATEGDASEPTTDIAKTAREKLDVELSDVVIVARWLDVEAMTCFSLASSFGNGDKKNRSMSQAKAKGRR